MAGAHDFNVTISKYKVCMHTINLTTITICFLRYCISVGMYRSILDSSRLSVQADHFWTALNCLSAAAI